MGARSGIAGGALAVLLLATAPAGAQTLGELGAFSDRDGCVKASDSTAHRCAPMRRQGNVSDLVLSPDGRRLYSVDASLRSVIAYRTLAGGGLRELTGPGTCAPLSGAVGDCRLAKQERRNGASAVVSPDGGFVYVASTVGGEPRAGVPDDPRTFVIDVLSTAGGLQRVGCVSSNGTDGRGAAVCGRARGLVGLEKIELSRDARNLYALTGRAGIDPGVAPADEGFAAFARDPESGALSQLGGGAGCSTRTGAGGECTAEPSFEGLSDLVLGAGGRAAYGSNSGVRQLAGGTFVLRRDLGTGALEPARGPGTCVGEVPERPDCTATHDREPADTLSVSPDGRFVYASGINEMAILAADESTATLAERGCMARGFPKRCMQVATDLEGARLVFTADGRGALVEAYSEVEALARDPETGAVRSRGCIASEGGTSCSSPVVDLATGNLAIAPDGRAVYSGQASTIYTLAPAATVVASEPLVLENERVAVPVRCDAPRPRACRGKLKLDGFEANFDVPAVPISVAAARTATIRVPVPARIRRGIVRRRRVEFRAVTQIGAPERRQLLSEHTIRVDAARGAPSPSCRRGGVRTLFRTRRMRVYTVRTPQAFGEVAETTYACLFSAGRRVRLDEPDLYEARDPFVPVGDLLAYEYELAGDGASDPVTYVRVMNLRTGAERRRLCAFGGDRCGADGDFGDVRRIVMRPNGGAAWTVESGPDRSVAKADAGAESKVLEDAEGQIKLGSLRLDGSRLTWLRGTKRRRATLR